MPVAGMLSISALRVLFEKGGEEAVKEYYNDGKYFLLVLSDGFSTHVTWSPTGSDTEEFVYTKETPRDGNEILDDDDPVKEKPKTTKQVKRSYFSPTDDEQCVFDPASLVVPFFNHSGLISVGRGGFNDVKLSSTSVSSIHASFIKDERSAGWGLVDRGSKNGTMLDGVPLEVNRLYPSVAPGREVAFADIRCVLLDIWGLIDVCSM